MINFETGFHLTGFSIPELLGISPIRYSEGQLACVCNTVVKTSRRSMSSVTLVVTRNMYSCRTLSLSYRLAGRDSNLAATRFLTLVSQSISEG
jgi:hypothetical protein